ncbi:MAG: 16S rRNA (uracil(1498)-N(3))-methyltransferase [Alphaproteobacteria bacterium]|nr:16S rRNA (uracil(1498)-N(3))-methyltransferase [Alphaproteobacteria bacterium]
MKNIPRIYINENLEIGRTYPMSRDHAHYLKKVMRTDKFIVFNNGQEFNAEASVLSSSFLVLSSSERPDPSNNITLAFAPIKQSRLEEMVNMATQLGVARLQPIITERTTAKHINWDRIRKIIIEAAEQSNRNSVPELAAPVKFVDFVKNNKNIVFGDERLVSPSLRGSVGKADEGELPPVVVPATAPRPGAPAQSKIAWGGQEGGTLLIGPEGGFSQPEFDALDAVGATGISLGATILRAETAAAIAIAKAITSP